MAENVQKIISIQLQATSAINGIKDLNQQIEINKTRMAELADANQKGSAEYAKLEQHTKALSKTKQALSRETQNEIKLEYEEKGSLNALRAELSNLTKQYDKLSKAERENVNIGGKLQKQINQVTNEIKAAEEGTARYYRNVGNYQNAIIGALGMNNKYIQSMMLIASSSQGVSGAFGAMSASAKAFGKTLLGLLKNPVFLGIAGIAGAGMAFKWFYDYNVEAEKALRLTREFTNVTGSALQDLRAEIQATASTFGKDYQDVLEGVDALMSHFHLTSEQAIKTLNDGFIAGADINGNYLQLLKQYAPTFKDAGISASQLVAYIQQTRSGIFSQQGLEAIKQASVRIREMSKGTRDSLSAIGINVDELQQKLKNNEIEMVDAIKLISTTLKQLPVNSQEVGNVMADVFGRQGKFSSQEMIRSLGDIETSLENLKIKAGDYGKALEDNQKATADLEKQAAQFFGVGENGWETLKVKADTFWKEALASAIKQTRGLIGWIAELGRKSAIFAFIGKAIGAVFNVVVIEGAQAVQNIFNAFGAGFNVLGTWIDAFVDTFKSAIKSVSNMARGFRDILSGDVDGGIQKIENAWKSGWTNALKNIKKFYVSIGNEWQKSAAPLIRGWNAVDEFFKTYNNTLGSINNGNAVLQGGELGGLGNGNGNGGGGSSSTKGNGNGTSTATKRGGDSSQSSTTKPQKSPEEIALEQYNKRVAALVAKGEELHKRAVEEQAKNNIAAINELAEIERQELYKTYGDRSNYEGEALEAWDAMFMAIEQKRLDSIKKMQQANAESSRAEEKKLLETWMASTEEGTAAHYEYMLKILKMEKEAELAVYEGNGAMQAAIVAKYTKQEEDIRREQATKEIEIEEQKMTAIGSIAGSLSGMMESFGEDSKEAVALAKSLALAEMMINQAVAISGAIRKAATDPTSYTVFGMIATIAGAIASVVGSMVQAFKSLNSAKFATGGYVQGAGTSTSDSIPVRVSNGESIMNAETTAMFSGLLSSLNQLGGGVPIQVQETAASVRGEDMLARAFARGVAMLPNPVVSVEDINRGQRQVEVMNERATL